ncbi:hypothetical protein F4678DRAFT_124949 [Xylaria arbuscula]|nr:hypothetical protein F4678DRAFT_124949 [Xylaria arbuscula]
MLVPSFCASLTVSLALQCRCTLYDAPRRLLETGWAASWGRDSAPGQSIRLCSAIARRRSPSRARICQYCVSLLYTGKLQILSMQYQGRARLLSAQ